MSNVRRFNLARSIFSVGIVVLALVAVACQGKDSELTREPLARISHVEIHRGYSSYKVRLDNREQVEAIVDEINRLRQKPWDTFIGKPGGCSMRLTFFRNDERLPFYLMVDSKTILEMPIGKKQPRYFLRIEPQEIPHLRLLLPQIGLPGNCRW